jgi:transcriptional regulator GlxA family with amidase domain
MRKRIAVLVPAAAVLAALASAVPAHGVAGRVMLSDFMAHCAADPSYCETATGAYIDNAQHVRAICVPKSVSQADAVRAMLAWLRKAADKGRVMSLDDAQWDAVNALWPCGGDENNKV